MNRVRSTLALAATLFFALGCTLGYAQRGSDGTLDILYWQAASTLNPYLSGGTKDIEAGSLILEPLARYDEQGNLVPWLVEEIPTLENGGIAEDLMSITWKLTPGILWSDGTPLTAEDVVFTGEYCLNDEMGCNAASYFTDVESVEAVDDLTVRVNFSVPKPFPYGPFVGAEAPVLQKAQFEDCTGAAAQNCTEENFGPIGTGPYKVTDFRANDVVVYEANENYREADKPAFSQIIFKGGGDAASAARAVLETGEADYAWNLQVEPEILEQMAAAGRGEIVTSFGTSVERILVNLTDDDPSLGENRSLYMEGENPHPFLSDPAVRRALSLAIDRQLLVDVGYGAAGRPGCNILPAPEIYASTANDECLTQDIEQANQILDEAGWIDSDGDGVREKDGVELNILYQTSTNSVRQATQALVKQMWEEIGVSTELRNIDSAVFFGGDPASPDTYGKFYADVEMFTNNFAGTDPEQYMANWRCEEIPDVSNQWLGNNIPRWCDPAYDALVAQMAGTAGLEARAEVAKELNDMLVGSYAAIPLIWRGDVSARAESLQGVRMNSWDSELWNVADWTRAE